MIIWWEDPDGHVTQVEVHWSVPCFAFLGLITAMFAVAYLFGLILGLT